MNRNVRQQFFWSKHPPHRTYIICIFSFWTGWQGWREGRTARTITWRIYLWCWRGLGGWKTSLLCPTSTEAPWEGWKGKKCYIFRGQRPIYQANASKGTPHTIRLLYDYNWKIKHQIYLAGLQFIIFSWKFGERQSGIKSNDLIDSYQLAYMSRHSNRITFFFFFLNKSNKN